MAKFTATYTRVVTTSYEKSFSAKDDESATQKANEWMEDHPEELDAKLDKDDQANTEYECEVNEV